MGGSLSNDRRRLQFGIRDARPRQRGRAFSLLELAAVVAILGLIAGMAVTRFGHDALSTVDGEGIARRLSLALRLARRQAICEGVNAAVVLSRDAGSVSSFTVVRAAASGDEPVDSTMKIPTGVTVSAADDRWEFDYTGALVAPVGGVLTIGSTDWTWTISVNLVTGQPTLVRAAI